MNAERNLTLNLSYNTKCLNVSHEWDEHELVNRDQIFKSYQGWLLLPFTIVAFTMTSIYILAVSKALVKHRVSRKFYALLLNRSIGDLISCIFTFIIIAYVLAAKKINGNWVQIINIFYMACFWSAMISYIGIGFMKLYGISRPLQYRNITIRKTKQLIGLSWVLFSVMVLVFLIITAMSKFSVLSQLSGCRIETCLVYMYRARNFIMVLDYITTIVCYLITVFLIQRAKKFSKSMQRKPTTKQQQIARKRQFPLIKLTVPVATLAIFHFPYAAVIVRLLLTDNCYGMIHYNFLQKVFGLIRVSLLMRIILDPTIALFMDREVRSSLFSILRITRISPENGRSNKSNKRSTTSRTISNYDVDTTMTGNGITLASPDEIARMRKQAYGGSQKFKNAGEFELQQNGHSNGISGNEPNRAFTVRI